MKTTTLFILIALSSKLFGQNTPVLSESELLKKEEIKKKVGWIKINIDSNFRETNNTEQVKYEFYTFCKVSGWFNYMFYEDISSKNYKIIYTKTNPLDKSTLLNGTLEFFDKKKHLVHKYILKDGFCIKAYYYKWDKKNGKEVLSQIFENIPTKTSIEQYANGYNMKGELITNAHAIFDGYKWNYLPDQKKITQ